MNSKQRILAALAGKPADHVPLTTWCFGFPAPPGRQWQTAGRPVEFWYTRRLEHIHTLPHPWTLEDEFQRAEAWLALGIDDVLEVSVPWSCDPGVVWSDSTLAPGSAGGDAEWPVLVREYQTPSGPLRHAVKKTPEQGRGWPLQPDYVPLFEDYNIPRAVKHAVASRGGPARGAAPLSAAFPGAVPAVRRAHGPHETVRRRPGPVHAGVGRVRDGRRGVAGRAQSGP